MAGTGWTVHHVSDSCLFDHNPSPQRCAAMAGVWDDSRAVASEPGGACLTLSQAAERLKANEQLLEVLDIELHDMDDWTRRFVDPLAPAPATHLRCHFSSEGPCTCQIQRNPLSSKHNSHLSVCALASQIKGRCCIPRRCMRLSQAQAQHNVSMVPFGWAHAAGISMPQLHEVTAHGPTGDFNKDSRKVAAGTAEQHHAHVP
jgi:hypothetical protein